MPLLSGNPVAANGQVSIVAGDDYKAADSRALVFANPAGSWPNLTSANVFFVGQAGNFPPQQFVPTSVVDAVPLQLNFPAALIAPVQGTVVNPSGSSQSVSFDLP